MYVMTFNGNVGIQELVPFYSYRLFNFIYLILIYKLWQTNHFLCLLYFIAFHRNSQRMPAGVTEALMEIFIKEGKMDESRAEEFLKSFESTWS